MATATKQSKSKDSWKKNRIHEDVTLPSGMQVDLELPNLAQLIESGRLPNALIGTAVKLQAAREVTEDVLKDAWEFARHIVPIMVTAPKIAEEDVDQVPYEDVEMLISFALRNSDMDAVGKHLGGLHRVQSFRDLRGIYTSDPDSVGDEGSG